MPWNKDDDGKNAQSGDKPPVDRGPWGKPPGNDKPGNKGGPNWGGGNRGGGPGMPPDEFSFQSLDSGIAETVALTVHEYCEAQPHYALNYAKSIAL